MASFISIITGALKTLVGIEKVAEPIVETILPVTRPAFVAVDGVIALVQNLVLTHEVVSPTTGTGSAKLQAVLSDFQAGLAVAQKVAGLMGKTVVYSDSDLTTFINAQVAAYNAGADFIATFKLADAAAPTAVAPAAVVK